MWVFHDGHVVKTHNCHMKNFKDIEISKDNTRIELIEQKEFESEDQKET